MILRGAAAALCVAAIAAGCGSDDPGPSTSAGADTDLRVVVDVDGDGGEPPRTATLTCAGQDESETCRVIADLDRADFAPTRPTQACTEIFGGPDVVTGSGTLRGEDVSATFTRANGCEIERFTAIEPLVKALFPGYEPGQAIADAVEPP